MTTTPENKGQSTSDIVLVIFLNNICCHYFLVLFSPQPTADFVSLHDCATRVQLIFINYNSVYVYHTQSEPCVRNTLSSINEGPPIESDEISKERLWWVFLVFRYFREVSCFLAIKTCRSPTTNIVGDQLLYSTLIGGITAIKAVLSSRGHGSAPVCCNPATSGKS